MAKERRGKRRKEAVNHPQHYGGDTTYEVIKVLEAWGLDYDFNLGNIIKYIARYRHKDTSGLSMKETLTKHIEDLEKAAWYLQRRIDRLKRLRDAQVK